MSRNHFTETLSLLIHRSQYNRSPVRGDIARTNGIRRWNYTAERFRNKLAGNRQPNHDDTKYFTDQWCLKLSEETCYVSSHLIAVGESEGDLLSSPLHNPICLIVQSQPATLLPPLDNY
ncbi:unnamed protein product [Nezara viridula]|uniref:Uncharacterized protein n=1 Tax=Nezara viridula TaxID=85310 RepID=A0A9P0H8W4_NEZVI|nr:unnamed protein product [Nezara viridula]